MYAFTYHRPTSVTQAAALLSDNEDARALAGGQTLLPTMKLRLSSPPHLVDLSRIEELKGIATEAGGVAIGAGTTHRDVHESDAVKKAIPALAEMAGLIGDPAVRHRGTIGGSIANNDPAADYPAACVALGATIVTNKRRIAADDFFLGLFETALEEGEIVTKVIFPAPEKAGYQKFRNPASRFALVGVFVAKGPSGVRVAVTGAGSKGVFRWAAAEKALGAGFNEAAIEKVARPTEDLNSDIHADAAYRSHLIGVMTKRAVAAAR